MRSDLSLPDSMGISRQHRRRRINLIGKQSLEPMTSTSGDLLLPEAAKLVLLAGAPFSRSRFRPIAQHRRHLSDLLATAAVSFRKLASANPGRAGRYR